MSLLNNTITALCTTFLRQSCGVDALDSTALEHTESFVKQQLNNMPDFLQFPMKVLTCVFGLHTLITRGAIFNRLSFIDRHEVIESWRYSRFSVSKDLIRFYATLTQFDMAFMQGGARERPNIKR